MHAYHRGRLTTTDASFLYFERLDAPMHIGAVAIFEGELPYESYVRHVELKLARLTRLRERVVTTPFFLGHPTWESDPEFEIWRHMPLHRLDAPGDEAQLQALANRIIAKKLERDRPLWEIHVIHGLEGGRSAILSKVHHAMVDGVGGNAILTTILDLEPEPPRAPVRDEYTPTREAARAERIVDAMWDAASGAVDVWAQHFKRLTDLGRSFDAGRAQSTLAMLGEAMPDLALPPRRLPFNRACGGERSFVWTRFSFAEARAVRGALGGTVNDVLLTALGGAVGRYTELHGQPIEGRTMRVMVPVNVRPEGDAAALGNLVSVLPVNVPLGVADPAQRLHSVRATTRVLKEGRVAEGVSLMVNLGGAVPAPLQAAIGAIAVSPFPIFNIVCTNVPGPQIPLYAEGLRLSEYYPYVPVGFDMGVACAIFSYNQQLFIGLNSDTRACPDIEVLRDFLEQSFAELKTLAGIGDIAKVETQPSRTRGTAREAELPKVAAKRPAVASPEGSNGGSAPPERKSPKPPKTARRTARRSAADGV